jgi:hypothetical protein
VIAAGATEGGLPPAAIFARESRKKYWSKAPLEPEFP